MKVVVFGATGATGHHIVRLLVQKNHVVTAFARTPAKVDTYDGTVRVVQGDARQADKVAAAITGQDAVVAAFGPHSYGKDDIQEAFYANVIRAMDQAGVKRLIMLSARGAGDSYQYANFFFRLGLATVLKKVFIDKNKAESLITQSDLDYTGVRPGVLRNWKAKGGVQASADGKGLGLIMARADVAAFMVDQLTDQTWIRQFPIIGYH